MGKSSSPSERLAYLLEKHGWNQKMLAAAAGYTEQQISRLIREHQRITPRSATRICACFPGTRSAWLLGYDDFETMEDFAFATSQTEEREQRILNRIFADRKALNQLLDQDEAWRRLVETLGFSLAFGEDPDGVPSIFIRNRDGEEIVRPKAECDLLREMSTSYITWLFSRLFENKEPGTSQEKEA